MTKLPSVVRERLSEAQHLGFIGPADLNDLIEHSFAFLDVVSGELQMVPCSTDVPSSTEATSRRQPASSAEVTVVDLGSGGGIPSLVIAALLPNARIVLVESSSKRAAWLQDVADEGLWTAETVVISARAEEVGRDLAWRGVASCVTARAFGRPAVVAESAAALLQVGGVLVVSEPPQLGDPSTGVGARWPTDSLSELGFGQGRSIGRSGRSFAAMTLESPCPEKYPRRVGKATKRPLWG